MQKSNFVFLFLQAKIEVYLRVLPSNSPPSAPPSFEVPFSTSHPSFLRPFPPFAFPPRPPDPSPRPSPPSIRRPLPLPSSLLPAPSSRGSSARGCADHHAGSDVDAAAHPGRDGPSARHDARLVAGAQEVQTQRKAGGGKLVSLCLTVCS